MINGDYEWGQALGKVKEHLRIGKAEAISFFAGKQLIGPGSVLSFYEKHKS